MLLSHSQNNDQYVIKSIGLYTTSTTEATKSNIDVVARGTALCKRSKCVQCGMFSYDYANLVQYTPSFCEVQFKHREDDEEAKRVDSEIRKKYSLKVKE